MKIRRFKLDLDDQEMKEKVELNKLKSLENDFKSPTTMSMNEPSHLVVLIHGVNGFASDCEYIGKAIRTAHDIGQNRNLYIAAPTVNQGLSHDGILLGSKRYLKWIKNHVNRFPSITEISIIGHSLGGLYARCLVGLLWKEKMLSPMGSIQPHTLITLATPHLPPRQHDWLFGRKFGAFLLEALIGKSGQDLLLKEKSSDQPILEKMAIDPLYLDPLLHFKRLITYANVKDDPVINYGNAALAYKDLCPKEIQKRYKDHPKPHIFHHDPESVVKDDLPGVNKAKMPDETMMDRLSSLPWIRYGIIPSRGILAHADMVVKFKNFSLKHGKPVVNHIASHFTPEALRICNQNALLDQEQEEDQGLNDSTVFSSSTCSSSKEHLQRQGDEETV